MLTPIDTPPVNREINLTQPPIDIYDGHARLFTWKLSREDKDNLVIAFCQIHFNEEHFNEMTVMLDTENFATYYSKEHFELYYQLAPANSQIIIKNTNQPVDLQ